MENVTNVTAIPDVGTDSSEFRYYAQNISAGDFTFLKRLMFIAGKSAGGKTTREDDPLPPKFSGAWEIGLK